MSIAKYKGDKGRCDTLFSLIIRSAGACERCGALCLCPDFPKAHNRTCPLTTSHIVSRRYSGTRCYLPNAQALCYTCHRRFTDFPVDFTRWLEKSIGMEAYEVLNLKAQAINKVDWSEVYEELKVEAIGRGIITPR